MAKQTLLTTHAKLSEVEQIYYSPVAVIPPLTSIPEASIYCFLSKVDPWADDNNPPAPTQDVKTVKQVLKNMFVAKRIETNNISPVIERIDWTTGTVYQYYKDDVDMFATNPDGSLVNKFYVKNSSNQVFKCLWNGGGVPSTDEPNLVPGSYGTNNIYTGSDGYKWKWMYSVDTGLATTFMTPNWLPVPVGANTPNPYQTNAGAGNIDVINMYSGGSGYDPANASITVTITGDGTGATANISSGDVVNGQITNIIVLNPGTNYTYANVVISSALGSGASANAYTSPIGGHGFDPVSELGTSRVMLTAEFNDTEGGIIPTDITYYQLGLVINPTTLQYGLQAQQNNNSPQPADGIIYSTTTDVVVAAGFGEYISDEIVWQGSSYQTSTFSGTVLSFDVANNVAKLINTTGTPVLNSPLFGLKTNTTRTLLSYNNPDFTILSGYVSYIENRSGTTRSPGGIEQIKLVLGF